ncbi:MAG TPA: hypothetical protein VGC97_25405 [Pyrinomonadaceae bacterium]|jgi:hypothetical protein
MKQLINEILFGKNSMVSGIIALAIISAIGLGCFCNKDKLEGLTNTGSTTPSPSASASPSPSPTKSYTKADASKNALPSEDEMQDIVKKTLLDFNDSLQKEDFTDFYGKISKYWQKQTSPEKLKTSFQGFIDGNADLSPIKDMTAKFTRGPETTRSLGMKTLEADGEYPTSPITTKFELKYIVEGKEWKLVGINVVTKVTKR